MRERRTIGRRRNPSRGLVDNTVKTVLRLWVRMTRRPVDSMAIAGAGAASLVIIVNAIFLQSGPHSAPFFTNPASPPQAAAHATHDVVTTPAAPKAADMTATPRPAVSQRGVQPVSARRGDPIGDLIGSFVGSPSRVIAVQRVLAQFGYGQIRATGTLDDPTSAAIEKFESEHNLPVTGRLSDRLLAELTAMTGRPIE